MLLTILIIHVIICILLVGIVLIQAGRGGGLVEGFSGVESVLGTKTSSFLTRFTTILSVLFFITCLSLAFLSLRQGRSLMQDIKPASGEVRETQNPGQPENPPVEAKAASEQPAAPEAPKAE